MPSLADQIVAWIQEQARLASRAGAVLGLSGGIDSAVVGALAKRALGDEVLGLIMPCHSSPDDEESAILAATKLGVRTERIDLTPVYDCFTAALQPGNGLALANLKPRLRMMTVYFYANDLGYLVLGTGNKSELTVGYFTKHGDGGVDVLPIGSLLKTQVRQLAIELDIPGEIIARPPSAGLWAGQTDEEEMGLSYEQLDSCIDAIENGRTSECDPAILSRVLAMRGTSEHKRVTPAIFKPR
ncbi:MAG: NAD+ synthase [Chloroflexi bacterium]|nr:NAD+ synthase [Chloroflexota bacterium]